MENKESLEDLIIKTAYSPKSTLMIKDRKSLFSTTPNSFLGDDFIGWLITNKFTNDKKESLDLANKLLSNKTILSPNKDQTFKTSNYYLFRNLKIVILGAGGAGLAAAKELQKNVNYDVTVVTKSKEYYFLPTLPFVFSGEKIWKKDFESILKNSKIIYQEVESVEPKTVTLKDGSKIENFDYLIVSTGSYYQDIPTKDNKTIVIKPNLGENMEEAFNQAKNAKDIVVVGSGIVGCEIYGPLLEYFPDKNITMITSSKTVMERRPKDAQTPVLNHLSKFKNGTIKFGQRVQEISEGKVKTDQGEFAADLVFSSTGFKPHTKIFEQYLAKELDSNGYVKVNEHMQMENYPHIFIGGDITNIKEEKLIQSASDHGKIISQNIKLILERAPLKKYEGVQRGYAVYLGSKGSLSMGDKQMWFGKTISTVKYYGMQHVFNEI